jgi:hypothetical protein
MTDPSLHPDQAAAIDVARWVGSPSADVRRVVAAHPATGAAVLDQLAADPDDVVRAEVAARPEISAETLARLRKDRSPRVVEVVRNNPSYRPGFFERLFSS